MSFRLNPARLAALYTMLRQLPPFSRWHLPAADAVQFRTPQRYDIFGEHEVDARHIVTVSTALNGHLETVLRTLAHEMIHVAQDEDGERRGHGDSFRQRALLVGKSLGWDGKAL